MKAKPSSELAQSVYFTGRECYRRVANKAAQEGRLGALRRLLTLCEHKADDCDNLIGWPALAASWREDVAYMKALIERVKEQT